MVGTVANSYFPICMKVLGNNWVLMNACEFLNPEVSGISDSCWEF